MDKFRSFSFTKHFKVFAIISAVLIAAGRRHHLRVPA